MAIVLYKCGDETEIRGVRCIAGRFPANQVQQRIAEGWVSNPRKLYKAPDEESADTNGTGKLSNKEIRLAAQTAGIEDWDTARITRLKKELGYGEG